MQWLVAERYQILITLLAAILPSILTSLGQQGGSLSFNNFGEIFVNNNNIFQSLFIFITLFVLVSNMSRTNRILEDLKEFIESYVERNTGKRYHLNGEKYFTYNIVSATVKQFYIVWIIVWVFWFIYYTGNFIFVDNDSISVRTFNLTFDFLSSTGIYIIYLILTDVTVKIEERKANGRFKLWLGSLYWIIIFAVWLALIVNMNSYHSEVESQMYHYNSLLMSVFSSLSFVLVLGKLNSSYLQIPRPFLLGMYVYAIFQAYVPFADEDCKSENVLGYLVQIAMPYATLLGKVIVMLSLCWIADRKRLIFFIIHESVAMDETPRLLDELDSDPVEF